MPEESAIKNDSASQQEKFYQGLRKQAEKTPNLRPEIKKTILGEETNQNSSSVTEPLRNPTPATENVQLPPTPEESLAAIARIRENREKRTPTLPPKDDLKSKLPQR